MVLRDRLIRSKPFKCSLETLMFLQTIANVLSIYGLFSVHPWMPAPLPMCYNPNHCWKIFQLPTWKKSNKYYMYHILTSAAGGPSTVMETKCSPLNKTKPNTLFSSLSVPLLLFDFTLLNSSQSPSIKFICLSKAKKDPIKTRPSCRVHRMR